MAKAKKIKPTALITELTPAQQCKVLATQLQQWAARLEEEEKSGPVEPPALQDISSNAELANVLRDAEAHIIAGARYDAHLASVNKIISDVFGTKAQEERAVAKRAGAPILKFVEENRETLFPTQEKTCVVDTAGSVSLRFAGSESLRFEDEAKAMELMRADPELQQYVVTPPAPPAPPPFIDVDALVKNEKALEALKQKVSVERLPQVEILWVSFANTDTKMRCQFTALEGSRRVWSIVPPSKPQ